MFPTERHTTSNPECSDKYVRVARSSFRSDASRRHPDVVLNIREFAYLNKRMRVKKLAHEFRVQLGFWNIDSLTGKLVWML